MGSGVQVGTGDATALEATVGEIAGSGAVATDSVALIVGGSILSTL